MREEFIASQPSEPVVHNRKTFARLKATAMQQRIKTEDLDERTPFVPKQPRNNTIHRGQSTVHFARPTNNSPVTTWPYGVDPQSSQGMTAPPPTPTGKMAKSIAQQAVSPSPIGVGHLPVDARAFTMPLPQRHSPVAEGVQLAAEYHRQRMHERLKALIFERLGVRLSIPDGVKPRRTDAKAIGLYSGSAKFGDIEEWLTNLVVMLAVNQFGGTDRDRERVLILSEFLDGEAKRWFNRHVIHVHRDFKQWTFEQVITGLYDWFIHTSTMQDARSAFFATRYTSELGVQGFVDALKDHSQNMS